MNEEYEDDEDLQPSQWRNDQWTQCNSSQRSRRGQTSRMSQPQPSRLSQGPISQRRQSSQQSQPSSRLHQGPISQPRQSSQQSQQSSQQSQPVTSTFNSTNNAAQDLLVTLIQSAVAGKLPAKEKKPKVDERERIPCLLCASTLATQTTLFRHYKTQHDINNPAQFLGYKESRVYNLDTTMEEFQCNVCDLVVPNGHALDVHLKTAHNNNDANNNAKQRCNECGFEANNRHQLDVHSRIHASSSSVANNNTNPANNTPAVNNNSADNNTSGDNNTASTSNVNTNKNNTNKTILDNMHKCDKCVCYFEEKRKLDEHMKDVHGREVVCNICNTYLPYEDYEDHFRNNHPEIYNTKNKFVQKKEKAIVRKFFRKRSGKIVVVYKCVKCNDAFEDEGKAKRHVKMHKRVKTTQAVDGNTEIQETNNVEIENSHHDKNILYTCGACKTSTASYDVVIEHSQSHLTDPNLQFVTKTCEICDLKFEPICYEHHVTRHCINEDLRKESFTQLEYDHNLLLSNDWFRFFNMAEEEWRRIISKSIYEHTRSVKMRVLNGENFSLALFQCGKCKLFVAPSSVANHTRNYDTCLRIKEEFPCHVCNRTFNARSTLDDHVKIHDDDNSFKVVVFNTDVDKTFNELLSAVCSKSKACDTLPPPDTNDTNQVLYKCMCSLCFVSKESADDHVKICPGKETRQHCQKCNYLFCHGELMPHYLKHHKNNETTFVIQTITPDVINVESDDEQDRNDHDNEVIDLSDDEEMVQMNTAAEKTRNKSLEGMKVSNNSNNEADDQDSRNLKTPEANRDIKTENQHMNVDNNQLPNCDYEEAMSIGSDDDTRELTDDTDSRDTGIIGGFDETLEGVTKTTESIEKSELALKTELKCVRTSTLINPLHYQLKTVTPKIELNEASAVGQISGIKEEKPWDTIESQYTRISGRPSLRSVVTSISSQIPYDVISLTDDEDEPSVNETVLNVSPSNITSSNNFDDTEIPSEPSEDHSNIDKDESIDTLAGSFSEVKENTVAIDRNCELEELRKIKQRLIALSGNDLENEYNEAPYQIGNESIIKELSLRAVFEKTHVCDQNVRIDIEYNSITNNRSHENSAISSSDHAPIANRNSERSHAVGNPMDFDEKFKVTSQNITTKQGEILKKAVIADDKAVVNRKDCFHMTNIARNDQNMENIIASPVVSRGKVYMRLSNRGYNERNEHNCCLS